MGFFGKLWSGVKEAASEVGAAVASGVRYAGKKLQEAGEWIDNAISNLGKNENSPTINYPPKNPSSGERVVILQHILQTKKKERENVKGRIRL